MFKFNSILSRGTWVIISPEPLKLPDYDQSTVLHRGPHSRIFEHSRDTRIISKFFIPRSLPRDALRKYFYCQAGREYRSARSLSAIGLRAPKMFGYAICLNPFGKYESLLLMERLPSHITAMEILRSHDDTHTRLALWAETGVQLGIIHNHGLSHRDCHMDNIIVTEEDRLLWIDSDIRRPLRRSRLQRNLEKSIHLMKESSRRYRRAGEWEHFLDSLGQTERKAGRAA